MRVECPDYREKIVPIESNFDAPDLGLDDVIREKLNREVQVSYCITKYRNKDNSNVGNNLADNFQHNCVR